MEKGFVSYLTSSLSPLFYHSNLLPTLMEGCDIKGHLPRRNVWPAHLSQSSGVTGPLVTFIYHVRFFFFKMQIWFDLFSQTSKQCIIVYTDKQSSVAAGRPSAATDTGSSSVFKPHYECSRQHNDDWNQPRNGSILSIKDATLANVYLTPYISLGVSSQ